MKKLVLVLVFALLLSSCSKNILSTEEVSSAAARDFCCEADMFYSGYSAKAKIAKNGSAISFLLTKPEEMAGFEISRNGETITVSFKGAQSSFEAGSLPAEAPFSLFCEMMSTLSLTEDFALSTAEEKTAVTGKNFVLEMQTADSAFVLARFPESETEFRFENFAFSAKN